MKTVVAIAAGIAVTALLDLDVIALLSKAMTGTKADLAFMGYIVTGLVLAGGSAGVNNILKSLGFRSQLTEEAKGPRPKPTEAWLAVQLKRVEAKAGPVQVFLTRDNEGERLIGTIKGKEKPKIFADLRTNPSRFPPVAGYAVPADSTVTVQLRDPVSEKVSTIWGPYTVAGGAIIDFELEL